ncbi:MAG: sulfite exporter TauE/SafE family protein, partial [Verrucomicrobiae bacterium]|nr:sulfite exporter TauE/SafE family protein [Verrucomicrobiae bacterium]
LVVLGPPIRHQTSMLYITAAFIGLVSGLASGMFGVGGGIVMVPAMVLLLKVDIKTAVGTSLAVIIPTAVTGALKHHDLGHLNLRMALALVPTAMIGGYIGSWLTKLIPSQDLKRAFGVFLILVGVRLIWFR